MLELSRGVRRQGEHRDRPKQPGDGGAQHGDNKRARTLLQENLKVIEELEAEGDPATPLKRYYVFNLLGYLAINEEGDPARVATLWEESLALAREAGEPIASG